MLRDPATVALTPALPAGDLIRQGVDDVAPGRETAAPLLVSIVAPRLRHLGVSVPSPFPTPERRLCDLLAMSDSDAAHSRYNALVRRLASFERALECARSRTRHASAAL